MPCTPKMRITLQEAPTKSKTTIFQAKHMLKIRFGRMTNTENKKYKGLKVAKGTRGDGYVLAGLPRNCAL